MTMTMQERDAARQLAIAYASYTRALDTYSTDRAHGLNSIVVWGRHCAACQDILGVQLVTADALAVFEKARSERCDVATAR